MRIKNYLTPYPILYQHNDDYVSSEFFVDLKAEKDFENISISADFKLTDTDILALIRDGKACYTLHVECPATSYRGIYESQDTKIEFTLKPSQIRDKVEVCSFILVKEEIIGYKNDNFNKDYAGHSFDLDAGNMLAIGDGKEFTIKTEKDSLESLPSIIKIYEQKDSTNGMVTVKADNQNYIYVGLSPEYFRLYSTLGSGRYKRTIMSNILLPSLMSILYRMKYSEGDEDRTWYKVILSILEDNQITLDDLDQGDNTILAVAQKIFGEPIGATFDELKSVIEQMED